MAEPGGASRQRTGGGACGTEGPAYAKWALSMEYSRGRREMGWKQWARCRLECTEFIFGATQGFMKLLTDHSITCTCLTVAAPHWQLSTSCRSEEMEKLNDADKLLHHKPNI